MSPIRSTPGVRQGRSRRRLVSAVLLAGLAVLATGCQSTAFTREGMPAPASQQGQVILSMWQGSWIAAWSVGIVVWGGILWAIIFHRKRGDQLPRQVRYNLPIEILYTVLPFIMVGVMFYFTARDENYITKLPAHPNVVVDVIGEQWSWQFQYPQYRTPGSAYPVVTEVGQMWQPGAPTSQQHLPILVIPAHETVQFNLTSVDVVHSFWIVPFEFKRDVIPNYTNRFAVTPTKTGSWIGNCTELCGVYHSRMLFRVEIVTPARFRQWILDQQAQQTSPGSVR